MFASFFKRFRFRYSLRMAAVVLTVLCIWLGWHANRAREQRLATEQLREIGATVSYDRRVEDLRIPTWIRTKIGDDYFLNVVEVSLHDYKVGRRSLALTTAQIDRVVEAMRRLPRLRKISFNYTQICDEDLSRFAPLASQIESLYFNEFHGRLTGEGIRHLATWPQLRELTVLGWSLDKASVRWVVNLPALESFGWCGTLDKEAFAAISECKKLERLWLYSCSFDGEMLATLQSAKRLKCVNLHNCATEYSGLITPQGNPIEDARTPERNYRFYPSGERWPLRPPNKRFRDWLDRILPGVEIQEMFTS